MQKIQNSVGRGILLLSTLFSFFLSGCMAQSKIRYVAYYVSGYSEDGVFSSQIFLKDLETGEDLQLTNSEGGNSAPVWSPNGKQIAFLSQRDGNYEIYVMNIDGSNQTNVTRHPSDDFGVDWSPDGSKLVFTSDRGGWDDIYVQNIENGEVIQLTNSEVWDGGASWAFDSKRFAYTSGDPGGDPLDIYVASLDSLESELLISSFSITARPEWSPDGSKLVFAGYNVDSQWGLYYWDFKLQKITEIINMSSMDLRSWNWLPDSSGLVQIPSYMTGDNSVSVLTIGTYETVELFEGPAGIEGATVQP